MRTGVICLLALPVLIAAQNICPPTPAYGICEITLEVAGSSGGLRGEFRSPGHRTLLIPAFRDGDRMILRVSPTEPGTWDFRLSDGKEGQFTATASDSPGFIEAANVHHFWHGGNHQPHLWMGDTVPDLDHGAFERFVNMRAAERFNHLRVLLLATPHKPDDSYFRQLDARLLYINRKGITADLVIARGENQLTTLFPEREERERFISYLVARYGAMNITWAGFEDFETYARGRELLKEVAAYIQSMDQYHHMQSTGTLATSAPLYDDGWMKYLSFRSGNGDVPAIEHQIYAAPGVVDFRAEDNSTDTFRKQLWKATMNGQYPGTAAPNEEAAEQMKIWFDFFAGTRHWELEPFFDVEGGRALALENVEYVIYVEKPGPVTVQVLKEKYDVDWLNPVTGEIVQLKNMKDETFSGEPPDRKHDWVLHIYRSGHKAGLLKSYKFESQEILMQEAESNRDKVPFEIVQPGGDTLSQHNPGPFLVKLQKETRGTRSMRYLWTGEVTAEGQSYRVIGTGASGVLQIPANLTRRYPASLHVRVTAMNAYGKVFVVDRNYQLTQ